MKKILFFTLIVISISGIAGFFIFKNYMAGKNNKQEKQTIPVVNQVPSQGEVMQFTTPSE